MISRRLFLSHLAFAGPVLVARPDTWAAHARRAHPRPRPGITGAKVIAASELSGRSAHLVPLFDGIRAIPGVADGISCYCGCAGMPGFYSLLSCFEGDGMARACPICQGEGRVTLRMHMEGKSLSEIRDAIDGQFG